jgi:tetratricopeptide (TPR) repeat protein
MQQKTRHFTARRLAATLLTATLAGLGTPWSALADVVVLRNGKELHGLVEDYGQERIRIKTEALDMWLDRSQIQEVRRESPADFHAWRGDAKRAEGDVAGALDAYRRALGADPDHPAALKAVAEIEAQQTRHVAASHAAGQEVDTQALLEQARDMLNRALKDEALEILAVAVERDPRHVEALALAADASLSAWSDFKVPEKIYQDYLKRLESVAPKHPSIAAMKKLKVRLDEQRAASREADQQRIFEEIRRAREEKRYDKILLNRIDYLLETKPDKEMREELREIRAEALKAGAAKVNVSISSPVSSKTPTPKPELPPAR